MLKGKNSWFLSLTVRSHLKKKLGSGNGKRRVKFKNCVFWCLDKIFRYCYLVLYISRILCTCNQGMNICKKLPCLQLILDLGLWNEIQYGDWRLLSFLFHFNLKTKINFMLKKCPVIFCRVNTAYSSKDLVVAYIGLHFYKSVKSILA